MLEKKEESGQPLEW